VEICWAGLRWTTQQASAARNRAVQGILDASSERRSDFRDNNPQDAVGPAGVTMTAASAGPPDAVTDRNRRFSAGMGVELGGRARTSHLARNIWRLYQLS